MVVSNLGVLLSSSFILFKYYLQGVMNMAKIIKLEENKVVIAKDDNTIVRVDYDALSFRPFVGDEVDLFLDGETYIVNEVKNKKNDEGINISIVNENNSSATNQTSVSQNQTMINNVTAPDNRKYVNKWIYIILALTLGGLGVHRFYAGQKSAVLYLVFCWTFVPAILSFIDAIKALFKKTNSQGLVTFN